MDNQKCRHLSRWLQPWQQVQKIHIRLVWGRVLLLALISETDLMQCIGQSEAIAENKLELLVASNNCSFGTGICPKLGLIQSIGMFHMF